MSLIVLLALFAAFATGCTRGGDGEADAATHVLVELDAPHEVPAPGSATIQVRLSDTNGSPVRNATLEVRGDMTHAGMAPVFSDMVEVSTGTYATADFVFTMGGDWVITVSGNLEDGTAIERSFELKGSHE